MSALFDVFGGRPAADIILAVLPLEFLALTFRRGARRDAAAILDRLCALAPGLCLLLAVREALLHGASPGVALWLLLSGPAHLADLARRKL